MAVIIYWVKMYWATMKPPSPSYKKLFKIHNSQFVLNDKSFALFPQLPSFIVRALGQEKKKFAIKKYDKIINLRWQNNFLKSNSVVHLFQFLEKLKETNVWNKWNGAWQIFHFHTLLLLKTSGWGQLFKQCEN